MDRIGSWVPLGNLKSGAQYFEHDALIMIKLEKPCERSSEKHQRRHTTPARSLPTELLRSLRTAITAEARIEAAAAFLLLLLVSLAPLSDTFYRRRRRFGIGAWELRFCSGSKRRRDLFDYPSSCSSSQRLVYTTTPAVATR